MVSKEIKMKLHRPDCSVSLRTAAVQASDPTASRRPGLGPTLNEAGHCGRRPRLRNGAAPS